MRLIAEDPIIRCMERTGYPPWLLPGGTEPIEWQDERPCREDEYGKQ